MSSDQPDSAQSADHQSGVSVIFSFPFRVYGVGDLNDVSARADDGSRARVCAFFQNKPQGTPLTADVPIKLWPGFKWSAESKPSNRLVPPSGLRASIGNFGIGYDALRLDFWGHHASARVMDCSQSLLAWIRFLTLQEWIGTYETHNDSSAKYSWNIDARGDALDAVGALIKATTPHARCRALSRELLQKAVERSVKGEQPPAHWTLWLEAMMHKARQSISDAILSLALSLEVARDRNFPRFAQVRRQRAGFGQVLAPPFDDTDLLSHLSSDLRGVIRRDLSFENAALFSVIKELYVARHHVAHGRPPIYPSHGALKRVDEADIVRFLNASREALEWIDAL